ncbi:MAG: alpha/beta hydrolase [Rhodobacteraceae bacterium]|nr:alpha/beta hydrolase [Paracoccaceae bacterium]
MARDSSTGQFVHRITYGDGGRQGLALHSWLAHAGAWKDMAAALQEPVRLTAFDLPGHGQSADWDGTGDYTSLCAKIGAGLIGAAPVDLIGHSGGAVAALQIALAMPERLRSLTLIEPVLFAAARGNPEAEEHAAFVSRFTALLADGDKAGATDFFTKLWGTGQQWSQMDASRQAYMTERIHLIGAAMPLLSEDRAGLLEKGGLESLSLPAMIILGEKSPPVIRVIAETLAARLPDVGLAEVPGAGHMLPITHPTQVAGLVDLNLTRD